MEFTPCTGTTRSAVVTATITVAATIRPSRGRTAVASMHSRRRGTGHSIRGGRQLKSGQGESRFEHATPRGYLTPSGLFIQMLTKHHRQSVWWISEIGHKAILITLAES